jgi:hypothetical protein
MADDQFQAWNHYVPRLYLKRFACSPGLIWHYPLLVSHESVPLWSRLAISRAAAKHHLYTVAEEARESDEAERWLAKEFDEPAEEAIERAVTGSRMTKEHWRRLVRFFGAQHARTPANYLQSQKHWQKNLPTSMAESLDNLGQALEEVKRHGSIQRQDESEGLPTGFPLRAIVGPSDDPEMALLKVEVSAGRKLWLWGIKNILRNGGPLLALEQHQWTILNAPDGLSWFTSDHPAVQMGLGSDGSRNLGGGWGSERTVLMLPPSPRNILYTEIGVRSPEKYMVVSETRFRVMSQVMARNALRSIFAGSPMREISGLRPRHVDAAAFQREKLQWSDWHGYQSSSERFEG